MTLRQLLAAICFTGAACIVGHPAHALYALAAAGFGSAYFVAGLLSQRFAIPMAEYAVGGGIGAILYLIVGGG